MVALIVVAVLAAGALAHFIRLERQGRSALIVTILLAELLVETVFYPNQTNIPAGLVHPGVGELTFRLAEVLVVVALVARIWVRGLGTTIGLRLLWWVALFAWMATAAVVGILVGNEAAVVGFEAKAVLYLGALALGAGVPLEALAEEPWFVRLLGWSGGMAVVLSVTQQTGMRWHLNLPLVTVDELGVLGGDLATIFSSLGVFCLVLAAYRRHPGLLAAAAVLLVAPLLSEQRAGMAAAVLAVLVVLVGMVVAKRRLAVTFTELGLCMALVTVLVVAPAFVRLAAGEQAQLPFADDLETALYSTAKVQSAESRRNQQDEAGRLIGDRPFFGWGLGTTYTHFQVGPDQLLETNLTHNVLSDLALRTGAVGVLLFLVAVGLSLGDGWRAWRLHPDPVLAALALAALAGVVGLLGKAMFESLFEKYRLAILLGLLLGIVRSGATSLPPAVAKPLRPGELRSISVIRR